VAERNPEAAALIAASMLVVGFTFSDDIVAFILDMTGNGNSAARPWLVFALDCLLVAAAALLKWRISGGGNPSRFMRQLVTGAWGVGATLVLVDHLILIYTADHRASLGPAASVWINLLASLVFVAAMVTLLWSALGDHSAGRSWLIPLAIGTYVVQICKVLWFPVIDVGTGCAEDVSYEYFALMAHILPVVLLALGIETNFVRRSATAPDLGRRVAPVLTIVLLSVALGLAFSMLVKAHMDPPCGPGAIWHEYISFVVTAQAMAIGLATLVWLMLSEVSAPHGATPTPQAPPAGL
jgi:hypothetical protein